ncbi:MAG: hypothetical protein KA341_16090, partial [Saprospiraceae bacterium]|nr:hypothetical protein [Saprospiraceae bacterium]
EGVNYMVRSPFYGRGEGVPKVFEDGHTIKGSEESQTMAVDGMVTIAPIVGNATKPIKSVARVTANRAAGNAFRDEVADVFESQGRDISKEVFKRTPFGKRFIDIEVSHNGRLLGGVETKLGRARYDVTQRAKDLYLEKVKGYKVTVIRKSGS